MDILIVAVLGGVLGFCTYQWGLNRGKSIAYKEAAALVVDKTTKLYQLWDELRDPQRQTAPHPDGPAERASDPGPVVHERG